VSRDGAGPPRAELEQYATDLFVREDPLLAELRAEMESRDLPMIQVPARTGLLLSILVRACDARRVLEVGTLGGYSALWMASSLPPEGRLLTLEQSPDHAELAREFIHRAGRSEHMEVRVGNADELLPGVEDEGKWDVVFIDADKERYGFYLKQAERLLRPGGLLLADNVFWQGRILEETGEADESTKALQEFNRALAGHASFDATILPVGDGVALGVRR